uniref:Uncharacterized protein n=1 Tax=Arundo donax TaxID=35708 RepID=A0A0A9AAP5_ARUDO
MLVKFLYHLRNLKDGPAFFFTGFLINLYQMKHILQLLKSFHAYLNTMGQLLCRFLRDG